jgi:cholesterol oxidase
MTTWDAIIIGSGFGGGPVACRLAESGASVLVLERGRRWAPGVFPRGVGDPWLYDNNTPEKQNGWFDIRRFDKMIVIQAAGVGGGSLAYSSVTIEPDAEFFTSGTGWPQEISNAEMAPFLAKAAQMLRPQRIPENQGTARSRVIRDAATRLGYEARLSLLPLSITFDPDWNYALPDAHNPRHSRRHINEHGVEQGTCVHLGNCNIGCDVKAKNTIDLNYLAVAEQRQAVVRPLCNVTSVEPAGGAYRVLYDQLEHGRRLSRQELATRVVVAAGSLGSTELLLRARDQHRTLPNLSGQLGQKWSPNGNVMAPDVYEDANRVQPGQGPPISSGLDFLDGSVEGQRFIIEDDGLPDLSRGMRTKSSVTPAHAVGVFPELARLLAKFNPLGSQMTWLGVGVDASNGRLRLRRPLLRPWRRELTLDWQLTQSRLLISAIHRMQKRISDAAGGELWIWPFDTLVTVHPLGGCSVGNSAANGVVDHAGSVFGYPNLYVVDGAVMPRAMGVNPSLAIAAFAERAAHLMITTSA